MSLGIKTAQGIQTIHSVHVKPSTTTKTITANGTYSAEDDGADGYSAVTVAVPAEDYSLHDDFTALNAVGNVCGNFDWSKPFEIGLYVNQLSDTVAQEKFMCGDNSDAYRCPKLEISTSRCYFCVPRSLSSDVEPINVSLATPALTKNVPTYIRAGYDGTKIYVRVSTDGETWTTLGEQTLSGAVQYESHNALAIGRVMSITSIPWIYFYYNKCYVKINGTVAWGREW